MIGRVLRAILCGAAAVVIWTIGWWTYEWLTDTGQVATRLRALPFGYCDYEEQEQTTAALRELFPTDTFSTKVWDLMRESRFTCLVTFSDPNRRVLVCERHGDGNRFTRERRWSVEFQLEANVMRSLIAKTYKIC